MTAIRHVRAFTRQIPVYPKEAIDERIEGTVLVTTETTEVAK